MNWLCFQSIPWSSRFDYESFIKIYQSFIIYTKNDTFRYAYVFMHINLLVELKKKMRPYHKQ